LKYENNPQLARPMGHWMAQAWLATNPKPDAIILPIPMHSSKQQKRGFNQAELLAESFCDYTRLPLELAGLERSRETTAQFGLTAADRAQNLAGAFTLGKSFLKQRPTQSVLLLDDIYTTGATVKSAIVTLRQHGIRVQGVIVLAKTLTTYPNR
jgi:ComF family protein